MATKTISLEIDAYERLKAAKRGKESFSAVVRRARFDAPESSGAAILSETRALYNSGKGAGKKTLNYWERRDADESSEPRISKSAWRRDG
jgi:hypothetical protein